MNLNQTIGNIRAFNRFYTNRLGLFNSHFLDSEYSFTEARILYEIFHDPDSSVRKIHRSLGVDEGYLSRTIERLAQQGLVRKLQSETDRRRYILSLSGVGKKIYRQLEKQSAASIAGMLEHLAPAEQAEVESCMLRIKQLLSKSGSHNHDPVTR